MVVSEKRIEDLKGLKFNVPSYQRGYRWTEHEVTTLLEDLYTHSKQNRDYKYCLQPLIVKKVSDNTYDVVDGQQRLTTIFIFLKFMSVNLVVVVEEVINTITLSWFMKQENRVLSI